MLLQHSDPGAVLLPIQSILSKYFGSSVVVISATSSINDVGQNRGILNDVTISF